MTDVVAIKLFNKEYQVKCPSESIADLQEAADYLHAKMLESYETSNTVNIESLFMIAALNICNELCCLKRQQNKSISTLNDRLQQMHDKIEQALAD